MMAKKKKAGKRGKSQATRANAGKAKARGNYILIMGPPGSGKGTQAELLSRKFGIPHISTGQMFRDIEKKDTPLGKEVRRLVDQGLLAPDELTNEVIKERLSRKDARKGYLLDGYPRSLAQAQFLEGLRAPGICIAIVIGDDEVVARISSRRVCSLCKENYNIITAKPRKDGRCDKCGGTLITRPDDKPAAIRRRLREYWEQHNALEEYYEHKGIFREVDGNHAVPEVFKSVLGALKKRKK